VEGGGGGGGGGEDAINSVRIWINFTFL